MTPYTHRDLFVSHLLLTNNTPPLSKGMIFHPTKKTSRSLNFNELHVEAPCQLMNGSIKTACAKCYEYTWKEKVCLRNNSRINNNNLL